MNSIKEIPIGIANSIAREDNFSWYTTLNFARNFGLNLIQLYINPDSLKKEINEIKNIDKENFNIFLHLPPKIISIKTLETVITVFPDTYLLIQHEKLVSKFLFKTADTLGCLIGYENDNPDALTSYTDSLKKLMAGNHKFVPVLDIPRFYHQHSNQYGQEPLTDFIYKIINILEDYNLPIVLHLLDSKDINGHRENWCPLFEGNLPLREILVKILENLRILGIILEYESIDLTEKSLENLRNFLKTG
ncbi:MAG: hypothetical protein JXR46_12565 [Calditrichaceae bacterium]|nr:hypothetical protein [Calditrichaceae bacterium]MBN2709869.1 hypothetical protein [Calditrichaceae bacterium]RQV92626.1 MAG: hypothetical protein EH224_14670 [Calditrichota bacterium]